MLLSVFAKCDEPHETQMISKKLQQTISENSSVARALIHVATLLREWIAVLSWRTEQETDERHTRIYALSRLRSVCCHFGTAAVLLLLLMMIRLFYFYCYAVPGTFLLISTTAAAAVTVQTVLRFLLCWLLGS